MAKPKNEPPVRPDLLVDVMMALENPEYPEDSDAIKSYRGMKKEKLLEWAMSLERAYQMRLAAWEKGRREESKRKTGTPGAASTKEPDLGTEKALDLARKLLEEIGRKEGSEE